MPPKARSNALRGPGRPKRAAAPQPAPVATTPAKRGRAAKADAVEVAEEPPKKRGRPAKAKVDEPAPTISDAPKRGRRANAAPEPAVEAPEPKKRGRRPQKEDVAAKEAPVTPKRRGRPARVLALILTASPDHLASPSALPLAPKHPKPLPLLLPSIHACAQSPVRVLPQLRKLLRRSQLASQTTGADHEKLQSRLLHQRRPRLASPQRLLLL